MNQTELVKAYTEIESRHNLQINTIICGVCGNIFSIDDKQTILCSHLKELTKHLKENYIVVTKFSMIFKQMVARLHLLMLT